MIRVAAAAYPVEFMPDFDAYARKLSAWVADADADLLVFPEYAAMELASLGGAAVAADLQASLHEVARHWPAVEALHLQLAARHGCHILGGSGPVFDGADRPFNRAVLYGPAGRIGHQDKQIMTRFEREEWHVAGAPGLRVFDTALGRIGILICYDSEFPLLGRALAEAGAEILLVPSCTDTVAGFNRVRIGAMARALESQCVVVQAPTVGACDWMPALDENRGRAAIYGPPDGFWPETGIIAEGAMDQPGWVRAVIDPARIRRSRTEGAVLPFAHWPEQEPCRVLRQMPEN